MTVEAERAPTRWIVADEPAAAGGAVDAVPSARLLEPPKAVDDGPWSTRLAEIAADVAPSGSTVVSRTDLPNLNAATVVFGTGQGTLVSIAIQRHRRPVTLSTITAHRNDGALGEWPTGTQYVQIDRTDQQLFQLVLARASGMFCTVTVATGSLDRSIGWNDGFNRSSLLATVRRILDADAVESITG